MKKLISLFLCIYILCSLAIFCCAVEPDGSIEVRVKYNGENITGGQLIAVRVGYMDRDTLSFKRLTDDKIIENIGKSTAVSAMEKYYKDSEDKSEFTVIKADVKNGVAKFKDLTTGLYLIYQEKAASGYSKLSPFLVTLPYTVDGKEVFDITVDSKSELERNPSPTCPTDDPDEKLPQTGQLRWPIPVMACSGMVCFILGWWLCFARRKDPYEK